MNKIFIFLLLFYCITSNFVLANDLPEDQRGTIEVILGIDKVIKLDFVPDTRVMIGSPSIVNYVLVPQKKEIVFKGIKSGKSSVDIRDSVGDIKARYLIDVSTNDKAKVVAEIKEFLHDVEGLEIGIKQGVVYVGGEIVVPSDIGRVAVILERHKDVLRMIELSPHTQNVIANKMQDEIQKMVDKNITVRVVNGAFWLEGVTDKPDGEKIAIGIAKAYMPDRLEDLAVSSGEVQRDARKELLLSFITTNTKQKPQPTPKQVKVISQFVELTKDYGRMFAMSWTPMIDTGNGGSVSFGRTSENGLTTKSSGTLSGTIANLFPKLNSAKSAGYARVIQSGMLITKNALPGSIKKSTTINYQLGGTENAQVVNSTVGLELNVTPNILADEKIDLKIDISVNLSANEASTQTTNNSVSTNLVVKNKESAVVGGVVQNNTKTKYDKDPPYGDEKPQEGYNTFFSLLKSKSYSTNKSQYVVFVTPEIIESAAEGSEEIRKKFRRRRK